MFNKFLVLIGKDYWGMSDTLLVGLAKKYHIGDHKIQPHYVATRFSPYKSKRVLPERDESLTYNDRKELITELIKRDKFAFSNLTWLVAIISLAVSVLQFVKGLK